MRRVLFIVFAVTLSFGSVALSEETAKIAEAGGVCDTTYFVAEMSTWTEEELEKVRTIRPAPTERMGMPISCPSTSTCVGGSNFCRGNPANCSATGSSSSIDMGSSSCELPDESLFECKSGKTVHLVTTQCQQCKCCSQSPACVCPLNCGEARTLQCM